MSLIAKFSLPADAFVLGDALELPYIDRIEFDCNIPARNSIMPYFWVWGSKFDDLETVIESEEAIEYVTLIDELEDNRLYRAEWKSHISLLLQATQESNAVLQKVTGEDDWELELLFEEHADTKKFTSYYSDTGINLKLERLHSLSNSFDDQYGLTPAQRETLETAEESGYYEEPQEVTMEKLAEKLDISLSAVSGRLRRGTSQLIRNTLL